MRKLTSVYFEEISSKTTKLSYVLPSNGLSIEFDQVQSFIMSTLSFSGLSRDTFIYIASGVGTLIFVIVIITVLYCCIRTKRKAKRKATISKETSARLIPTIERISSNKRASTTSSAASYIKPRDINVEYSRNVHTPAEYVKLKQENDEEDQGRLPGGYSGSSTKSDTNNQHKLTPPSSTGSDESEQPQNYAEPNVSFKPTGSTQYVKMIGRSIEGGPYITPPINSTEISRPESYIDLTENNLGLSRNSEKFKEGDYNSVSQADIKNGVESESETNDYQNSPRKRKLTKPVEEPKSEYVNTLYINNNHEVACGNSQRNEFDSNRKDTCRNYENSSNLAKQKQDRVVYANLTKNLTPIPAVRENCVQKDKNKGKRVRPTPPKRGPFVKKYNQNINSPVEQIPARRESITKNKKIKERPERPASVKHSDESEDENNYNDVLEVEITKRESSVECSNINRQEKRDSSYVDMEGVTLYQEETPLENT